VSAVRKSDVAIAHVRNARHILDEADRRLTRTVTDARNAGVKWKDIAEAVGMSTTGAYHRYNRRVQIESERQARIRELTTLRNLRNLSSVIALVTLITLTGCNLSSTCEGGQRVTRLWNNTGTNNLTLIDSDVIPPEDLPVVLIPDTNNQPGEDDGIDAISWTNTEPTDFFIDYQWDGGPVQHAEGTAPACP
jgi:hypothetical protein